MASVFGLLHRQLDDILRLLFFLSLELTADEIVRLRTHLNKGTLVMGDILVMRRNNAANGKLIYLPHLF